MNLKYIREYYDLKQSEVASILGVTRSCYSLWEVEINIIPLNRLITFCDHFDVSLDYTLNLTKIMKYDNMKKEYDKQIHQQRLKRIRKENNYTQALLASKLHTDNGVISRYESGKTLILTSFLIDYCKIFNISADYLMGRIDDKITLKEPITN